MNLYLYCIDRQEYCSIGKRPVPGPLAHCKLVTMHGSSSLSLDLSLSLTLLLLLFLLLLDIAKVVRDGIRRGRADKDMAGV